MSLSRNSPAARPLHAAAPALRLVRYAPMALLACALLVHGGHARSAMYKWVDDKGAVHYTDKMPVDAVDRANVEMRNGVAVRKVDPAMTPEQRRAQDQEQERRRQLAKQQEEGQRRDRALLASYSSEREIDLARQRAVGTVDAVVQSSQSYSEQLNRRKADLVARMAEFKGKQMPPVWERELENLNEELVRQSDLVVGKRKEIAAINAKYDADKSRYRELVTAKPSADAAVTAVAGPAATRK